MSFLILFYEPGLMYLNWFNSACCYLNYSSFEAMKWFQTRKLKMLLYYAFVFQTEWDLFQLLDDLNQFIIRLVLSFWTLMRSGVILNTPMNYKCDGMILNIYRMKWYLICILQSYMSCMNVLRWYMHIWDCEGCYCIINNGVLDYRIMKVECLFRTIVVEELAFKCA